MSNSKGTWTIEAEMAFGVGWSFIRKTIVYLVLRPVLGAGGDAEASITSTVGKVSQICS